MANWKTTVKLGDLHDAFDAGDITVQEVAAGLAARLEENPFHEEIDDIIDELKTVTDVEHYDYLLGELYDFGDADHRIWIDTF